MSIALIAKAVFRKSRNLFVAIPTASGLSSGAKVLKSKLNLEAEFVKLFFHHAWSPSPLLMRFINSDPVDGNVKDSRTLNKYAYANGNPISRTDPEGKFAWIAAGAIVGGVFGGGSQILSNISEGKTWYSDVAGATVGGALNGGILAATGGTSLLAMGGAALAGGAAQSIINEGENYITNQEQLSQRDLENSIENIAANTVKNSVINILGNVSGDAIYKTDPTWEIPSSWSTFFTKIYGHQVISQTTIGAGISYLESMTEYYFCKYGKYATSMAIK